MKRYCRYCKQITDFQIWSEWKGSMVQRQAIVCPKCEHPRSWMDRRRTGEVVGKWQDPMIALVESQPEVKRILNEMYGAISEKHFHNPNN